MAKFYCIYAGEEKWLGNMKKWMAYSLALHIRIYLKIAKHDLKITIKEEEDNGTTDNN